MGFAGRKRPEQPVLEQELRGAGGGLPRLGLSGRDPVLVQAPHRRQRLVERGAVTRRLLVAVPAAVRPLPLDERLCQQPDARIVREPEAARQTASALPCSDPHQQAPSRSCPAGVGARWPLPVSHASTVSAAATQRCSPAGTPSSTSETSRQWAPPHLAYACPPKPPSGRCPARRARTFGPSRTRAASGGRARRGGRASPGRRSRARPSRAASRVRRP